MEYNENQEYTVNPKDKKISVVDVANTGVVHDNMSWVDGLHQFLQFKHGAEFEPESVNTNFLSNPEFFMRYRSKGSASSGINEVVNVIGVTGTLGG